VSASFERLAWKNITSFNWEPFTDLDLKRKFRLLSVLGPAALKEDKLTQVLVHYADIRFHYDDDVII
jgi:ABC-type cobalamin/Fe3+-siderophores transport system ATPase subunit